MVGKHAIALHFHRCCRCEFIDLLSAMQQSAQLDCQNAGLTLHGTSLVPTSAQHAPVDDCLSSLSLLVDR